MNTSPRVVSIYTTALPVAALLHRNYDSYTYRDIYTARRRYVIIVVVIYLVNTTCIIVLIVCNIQ